MVVLVVTRFGAMGGDAATRKTDLVRLTEKERQRRCGEQQSYPRDPNFRLTPPIRRRSREVKADQEFINS